MRTRTKNAMVAALLTTAVATGAGVGICLLKGNTDSAQAQTTHSYLAHSLTSAQVMQSIVANEQVFTKEGVVLTQEQTTEVELTGVPAGQYCIKLTATSELSGEYFDITVTAGGSTIYLSESANEDGIFYGVINVSAGEKIYLNTTSAEGITVNISVETLFMNPGNGYNLAHVIIPAASTVSVDIQDSTVLSYTVMVDLGNQTLSAGATLSAFINNTTFNLRHDDSVQYTNMYTGTLTLPAQTTTKTLTITSTDTKALTEVTVTLMELSEIYPIANNTATAHNIGEWETAIFSYEAKKSGYVSVDVTSPTTTVSSVEVATSYALTAGTGFGTAIFDATAPVYLAEGTTYYFESLVTGITPVAGNEVTAVDLTITISDWQEPEEITVGSYSMPVTPTREYEMKLNLAAGDYSITIIDVPFSYYTAETPIVITAHIGEQAIQLTRDNNYSAVVTITNENTVYFTTSENTHTALTFALNVYEAPHYIVPGNETTINIPANDSITYFIQNAPAGVYSIRLSEASPSVSVMVGDVTVVPEDKTTGGFVVRHEGGDFAITFVNSGSEAVEIAATVTPEARDTTIELDSAKTITLNAATREAYFMYSLAAGTYNLTVSPATNITLMVDGVAVDVSSGTATITISNVQDANGLVNFTFENTGATTARFTVTVEPSSNIVEVGDTFTINAVDYEYHTTYYAKVTAGHSYALTLDVPEGMSVVVTQNGTDLIFYGGKVGAFTAQADGYVTLRFTCYTYGNETNLTAHFIESAAMPINRATDVDTTVMSTYVAYLYPGTYHINLSEGANVKISINSVEITSNSFEVYLYSGVTITFVNAGSEKFSATLVPDNMMTLGAETDITLTAYNSVYYYINLTAGTYQLTVPGASNLLLQIDGVNIAAISENTYVFTVTSGYHAIGFINNDFNELTFKATVTTANLLVLDDDNEVTIEAGMHSKTYYIDLAEGDYSIRLELPDGTEIQVTVNSEVVVEYGSARGTFTVSATEAGYVQVIFTTESDAAVTFTVRIYEA